MFPSASDSAGTVRGVVSKIEEPSNLEEGYRQLHLTADRQTFIVSAKHASSFGVEVGDDVELSWDAALLNAGYPQRHRVTLKVRDRLAFFYDHGNELPAGFSREWGEVQCTGRWLCYTWESRALRLTGPCGDTVELGTDRRAELCGYEVLAGTLQHEYPERVENTCNTHPFVGHEVTIVRPSGADSEQDAGR